MVTICVFNDVFALFIFLSFVPREYLQGADCVGLYAHCFLTSKCADRRLLTSAIYVNLDFCFVRRRRTGFLLLRIYIDADTVCNRYGKAYIG
jgi:hypothetical protein